MSYTTNPPRWCPSAIPTRAGWKHPTRKEILVSVKLSQEFIDSYMESVTQNEQSEVVVNNEKQTEESIILADTAENKSEEIIEKPKSKRPKK